MTINIARLAGPVQAVNLNTQNNVHVVPTGKLHVVKSIILHNGRSDGQTITYQMGIIPSGQTFDSNIHPWIRSDSVAAGAPKSFDFAMLCLNAGDTVYVNPTNTGLYYEAHGLVSQ